MAEKPAESVRVRMAPSPTGPLHIGTARTTLFNWLFARKHRDAGGKFILRIEDTDRERSKKEYEDELVAGLHWLGIEWDEFYRQSERTHIYREYLEKLFASGDAYYCYCTKDELEAQRQAMLAAGLPPKYNGHCRAGEHAGRKPQVIRFKVPEVTVEFKDLIRGKISFDASLIGDQVIAKDLDTPLYNFAVVVDDELMRITHVIRGEDHLSNTPKQILIQRALKFPEPHYAHIPLILNPDRSKMSKRFADTALAEYRAKGYLPEAILNFLALLGWHPKDDREVLSKEELVREFDLARVQKSGAVFNQEKLDWLNREYMKKLSNEEIAKILARDFLSHGLLGSERRADASFLEKLVAAERSRAATFADFAKVGEFFFKIPEYDPKLLVWQNAPLREVKTILEQVHAAISSVSASNFQREALASAVAAVIGEGASEGGAGGGNAPPRNRGAVLWPLRVALSGQAASPDPIEIMEVLGKDESLARIEIAIKQIS